MSWADATTETSLIEMSHFFNTTINQIKVQDHRSLAELANTLGRELSQPGFPRIVPRVLVSCISRQDTYPKCLPSNHMLSDHPGPLCITLKVYHPLQAL